MIYLKRLFVVFLYICCFLLLCAILLWVLWAFPHYIITGETPVRLVYDVENYADSL
jgi:hypothetical protein